MKRKWWKIRTPIKIFIFIAIGIGTILWIEEVQYYSKKLHWTEYSLRLARMDISKFRQITSRDPNSLNEIYEYAKKHRDSGLYGKKYGEYLTDTDGNKKESQVLNGQGGLFYNKETGEVKVNLTKPVKSYLHLYFGASRNDIPADW